MIETSRRSLLLGLTTFVAAPAIVRASSLMPVKALPVEAPFGMAKMGLPEVQGVTFIAGESISVGDVLYLRNDGAVMRWSLVQPKGIFGISAVSCSSGEQGVALLTNR